MNFCTRCGARRLRADQSFCTRCGQRFPVVASAPTPQSKTPTQPIPQQGGQGAPEVREEAPAEVEVEPPAIGQPEPEASSKPQRDGVSPPEPTDDPPGNPPGAPPSWAIIDTPAADDEHAEGGADIPAARTLPSLLREP